MSLWPRMFAPSGWKRSTGCGGGRPHQGSGATGCLPGLRLRPPDRLDSCSASAQRVSRRNDDTMHARGCISRLENRLSPLPSVLGSRRSLRLIGAHHRRCMFRSLAHTATPHDQSEQTPREEKGTDTDDQPSVMRPKCIVVQLLSAFHGSCPIDLRPWILGNTTAYPSASPKHYMQPGTIAEWC